MQEAFHVAKMAFRHFKIRVRKSLTPSYGGSNEFDDAVSEYIICHLDLYDSQSSVNVSAGSLIGAGLLNTDDPAAHSVPRLCNGRAGRSSIQFTL